MNQRTQASSVDVFNFSPNADMCYYFEIKACYLDSHFRFYSINNFNYVLKNRGRKCNNKIHEVFKTAPNGFNFSSITNSTMAVKIVYSSSAETIIFDTLHLSSILPAVLARLFGKRVVQVIHDQVAHPGPKWFATTIVTKLLTLIANEVVIYSKPIKKDYSNSHVTFLPPWPSDLYKFDSSHSYPFSDDTKFIMFFGRGEAYKGLDMFSAIAKRFSVELPNIKFLCVGKNVSKYLGFKDNILVIDEYVDTRTVLFVASKATAVLLPYRHMTQSGVINLLSPTGTKILTTGASANLKINQKNVIYLPFLENKIFLELKKILRESGDREETDVLNISEEYEKSIHEYSAFWQSLRK